MNDENKKILNKMLKPGAYTPHQASELYSGIDLIEDSLKEMSVDYKNGQFPLFFYKLQGNKLHFKTFYPMQLELADFKQSVIISKHDLIKAKVVKINKINQQFVTINKSIPYDEKSNIELQFYTEEYEIDLMIEKSYANIKEAILGDSLFNMNQFWTQCLFSKLYFLMTGDNLQIDALGMKQQKEYKNLYFMWLYHLDNVLKNKKVA